MLFLIKMFLTTHDQSWGHLISFIVLQGGSGVNTHQAWVDEILITQQIKLTKRSKKIDHVIVRHLLPDPFLAEY